MDRYLSSVKKGFPGNRYNRRKIKKNIYILSLDHYNKWEKYGNDRAYHLRPCRHDLDFLAYMHSDTLGYTNAYC